MRAAVRPSWVARMAAVYPPLPPPMATRSKASTTCSSQRQSLRLEVSVPLIAEIQVAYSILAGEARAVNAGDRAAGRSPGLASRHALGVDLSLGGPAEADMTTRVAIVGVGQTAFRATSPGLSYKELMFEAATRAYADAACAPRTDIDSFLPCSEGRAEGTSIFDEYVPDQIGGAERPVYTVGGDTIQGMATAYMQIASGIVEVVAVEAHSKASNVETPGALHAFALDPVFVRPLGFNAHALAGMEASMYLSASGNTREQCAHVAAKNRRNALANPVAAHAAAINPEDVLASPPAFEPLSDLDVSAPADGALVIVLPAEERAKKLKRQPVWVRGIGWATVSGLTAADGASAAYARSAAEMAYRLAGIREPRRGIDFAGGDHNYSFNK